MSFNYDVEELVSYSRYGSLKRSKNSEIFQYPVVPSETVCPCCKMNKVLYEDCRVNLFADTWASNRVCADCKFWFDRDDFGEVIPDSEFEEFPEHDGSQLFLNNGRVIRID